MARRRPRLNVAAAAFCVLVVASLYGLKEFRQSHTSIPVQPPAPPTLGQQQAPSAGQPVEEAPTDVPITVAPAPELGTRSNAQGDSEMVPYGGEHVTKVVLEPGTMPQAQTRPQTPTRPLLRGQLSGWDVHSPSQQSSARLDAKLGLTPTRTGGGGALDPKVYKIPKDRVILPSETGPDWDKAKSAAILPGTGGNVTVVGTAKYLGRSGNGYSYEMTNHMTAPMHATFKDSTGQSFTLDLAPGQTTKVDSKGIIREALYQR